MRLILITYFTIIIQVYAQSSSSLKGLDFTQINQDLSEILGISEKTIDIFRDKIIERLEIEYVSHPRGSTTYNKNLQKNASLLSFQLKTYRPVFEHLFYEKNLPQKLILLSFIESHLNPRIGSTAGARGIWQFMPKTAKLYNLEVNEDIDQRENIYLSAKAAAKMLDENYHILLPYFQKLYNIGDNTLRSHRYLNGIWEAVMISYNAGIGNVEKFLKKDSFKRCFKEENSLTYCAQPYLIDEADQYVIRFIAAHYFFGKEWQIMQNNFYDDILLFRHSFDYDQKNAIVENFSEEQPFPQCLQVFDVSEYPKLQNLSDIYSLNFLQTVWEKTGYSLGEFKYFNLSIDLSTSKKVLIPYQQSIINYQGKPARICDFKHFIRGAELNPIMPINSKPLVNRVESQSR